MGETSEGGALAKFLYNLREKWYNLREKSDNFSKYGQKS